MRIEKVEGFLEGEPTIIIEFLDGDVRYAIVANQKEGTLRITKQICDTATVVIPKKT